MKLMKKHFVIALTACLIFWNFVPTGASANTGEVAHYEDNYPKISIGAGLLPNLRMMLTESGGSKYRFVSKQVVNLNTIGVNKMYQAIYVGGFTKIPFGNKVTKAIVGVFLPTPFKQYKYMRQTIYKKSDSKFYYYKVIDEFSDSKSTWKGSVQTTVQKVRR
ncbi:hypothetical protein DSO10_14990 [Listeria monocytogenes]|nr:hypothetical protein [Listeria monocytogenes]